MEYVIKFLYDFVLLFLIFYIVYRVFINKRKKEYSKLKKTDFVKVFVARYDLDIKKTKYKTILNTVALINSIIISFTSTLILNVENYFWKIAVSFIVVFVLVYSLYEVSGRILKNKEDKHNV